MKSDNIKDIINQNAIPIFTQPEIDKGAAGLSDGCHHILKCRNCNTPLADIFITKPDIPVAMEVMANCALCGDESWRVKVNGGFHVGVAVVDKNGNFTAGEGKMYVKHETYDADGDLIIIKTGKIDG